MLEIRYAELSDKGFWYTLDKHLLEDEFTNKVALRQGYVLLVNGVPAGLLRYNLFWDNTPFCILIYIAESNQGKGCGRLLMNHWELDMKNKGFGMVMTSTQVDEQAQHFYRKLGYKDCGGFVVDIPGYAQPMELMMIKSI